MNRMTSFICVFPLTLVTEPRVAQAQQGKLEEDSEELQGLQACLFSPGSGSWESSKTTDKLRQTKAAHGRGGVQAQTKVSIIVVYRT